jgi:hypothetical protein
VPDIDVRSLSVCIQALQRAIRFNELMAHSETVDEEDYEQSSYMYELELSRLAKIYRAEEAAGRVDVPLSRILRPPFDDMDFGD